MGAVTVDAVGVQSTLVSYLLEKSRVVFQTPGERNYHIFYQLVAGADENSKLRDRLMLDGCEAFHYLNQSGVTRIEGQVEEVQFDEVRVPSKGYRWNAWRSWSDLTRAVVLT